MESRCTGDHNNPKTATWLQQQTGETRSDSAMAVLPTPLRIYMHNDQAQLWFCAAQMPHLYIR